jgi:hypothetical protein
MARVYQGRSTTGGWGGLTEKLARKNLTADSTVIELHELTGDFSIEEMSMTEAMLTWLFVSRQTPNLGCKVATNCKSSWSPKCLTNRFQQLKSAFAGTG